MGLLELFILAVGLSMDAFAVSVCKGLSTQKLKTKHYLIIREGCSKEDGKANDSFSFKTMIVLAVATSIDALAVGITFALLPDVNIVAAVSFIGVITFIISAIGLKVGNIFGLKYKSKAEIAGGVILILIGTKILLEHLGVINF